MGLAQQAAGNSRQPGAHLTGLLPKSVFRRDELRESQTSSTLPRKSETRVARPSEHNACGDLGNTPSLSCNCGPLCPPSPAGTTDHSPVLQHWVGGRAELVLSGTAEVTLFFSRPWRDSPAQRPQPSTKVLGYFQRDRGRGHRHPGSAPFVRRFDRLQETVMCPRPILPQSGLARSKSVRYSSPTPSMEA